MGLGITAHRTRNDYVSLGTEMKSVSLASLPKADRELIQSDPVLKGMVHSTPKDQVIRGEDFGKLYDRLHTLDTQSKGGATSLNRADAMYQHAKSAQPVAFPSAPLSPDPIDTIAARTRLGIFGTPAPPKMNAAAIAEQKIAETKLDKTMETSGKLEKAGKYKEAAEQLDVASGMMAKGTGYAVRAEAKAAAARNYAHAGSLYMKAGDELAAKGDKAGATQMYKKAGDAYANAVSRMGVGPHLATLDHWDPNSVADWGLNGIEAYQKAGLSIQKNGEARTIGNLDVNKVEKGIGQSYGFDRGMDLGQRWMRFGDALSSTDKPAALDAYKSAKGNFEDAIREDKKFYPEGLEKHVIPAGRAALKVASTEAAIEQSNGKNFPATDYRAHLLAADQASGTQRAVELARALEARKPPMPKELRAAATREAADAVAGEMKSVENSGTPVQKAEMGAKAAEYLTALQDPARAKEGHAMAARANLQLAEKATDPKTRAELYAKAAQQMSLSEKFLPAEMEKMHGKAAVAFKQAAALEKNDEKKAKMLENAGDEFRAAKQEKEAIAAFRESGHVYLASVGEPKSVLTSKTPGAVTVMDLGGVAGTGDIVAEGLGESAAVFQKAGQPSDVASATALRVRSEAIHNLSLREKFKDPIFSPPVALDKGEVTPKSIRDYENAVLKKNTGDFKATAAEFDKLAQSPKATGTADYFQAAAGRMRALQTMKDAGVKDVQNPPTRKNLEDFAKVRAEHYRSLKDTDALKQTDAEVAQHVSEDLAKVTDPFYRHRGEIGNDIDYKRDGNNTVTVDPTGKMHGDCEVYAYDVAMAMEAAGFKASTETRSPNAGGASHVIVNLHTQDGAYAGSLSNNRYYSSADAAFVSVGIAAGSSKDHVVRSRAQDWRAPKVESQPQPTK
jgi:hypothetical protein